MTFGVVRATSDPLASLRENPRLDAGALAREEHRLGLDRPLAVQYTRWLGDFVRGNWGQSLATRRSVGVEIRSKLWNSAKLGIVASMLAMFGALGLGLAGARRAGSPIDHAVSSASSLGLAIPTSFLAITLIELGTYRLSQAFGWDAPLLFSVGMSTPGSTGLLDSARHLALPAIALAIPLTAAWSRVVRASLLDTLSEPFIRTARAKGLSERAVLMRHALPHAVGPVTQAIALDAGLLVGGAVVTETVFAWPGMGRLLADALAAGDTAIVMPWLMVAAFGIVVANLIADLIAAWVDPRVRLS